MADLAQPIYKNEAVKTDTYLSPYQKKELKGLKKVKFKLTMNILMTFKGLLG